MVKIRLARFGKKRQPYYRIVAADISSPRDGRHLERLGWYDPRAKVEADGLRLNLERVDYWLGVGARPTARAATLIDKYRSGDLATAPAKAPAPKAAPAPAEPVDAKVETIEAAAAEAKADDAAEAKSDDAAEAKSDDAAEAKTDDAAEAKADDAAEAKADDAAEATDSAEEE